MKFKLTALICLLLVSCQPSYAALYDNTQMCLLHAEYEVVGEHSVKTNKIEFK